MIARVAGKAGIEFENRAIDRRLHDLRHGGSAKTKKPLLGAAFPFLPLLQHLTRLPPGQDLNLPPPGHAPDELAPYSTPR
jgi:hypothetical protein